MADGFLVERCRLDEIDALALSLDGGGTQPPPSPGGDFDAGELEEAARLRLPKRRRQWLAGRLAAKRVLRRMIPVEIPMSGIAIRSREDRSPECARLGHDGFSISHSGDWAAAAAVPAGALVGIDLEAVAPRTASFLSLCAHPSEIDARTAADPREQTTLWTMKEAVSKLLRVGLSAGFWDIRFPCTETGRRVELFGEPLARWEAAGRPEILLHTTADEREVLTVAYTRTAAQGADHD